MYKQIGDLSNTNQLVIFKPGTTVASNYDETHQLK
jgi:hypothetical protein